MPVYSYTAKDTKGQDKSGALSARSKVEVARELRRKGLVPIKIGLRKGSSSTIPKKEESTTHQAGSLKKLLKFDLGKIGLGGGVSTADKMIFSRHLAVMISAGVPITRALEVLSKQTKNVRFHEAILEVASDIRKGKNISDALARHPKVFDSLYTNMVRSGDSAGNLAEVLDLLAEQLKKEHELKSRVRGALMYPSVIVVAMGGIGALMMVMVVPKISEIFKDIGTDLPFLTRVVIGASDTLARYWIFAVVLLPVLFYGVKKFSGTERGKKFFSWVFLKTPLFSGLTKKINSARFARTLSSLAGAGVPILEGLDITAGTLGNAYYKESLTAIRKDVRGGKTLFESIEKFDNIYPGLIVQMVRVGEETGALSEVLGRIAHFYEEEVANTTQDLSSIIEPILMLVIGAVVGIFAISMIQPMYSLMGNI